MRSDQWVGNGNSRCSWRYSRPVGWEWLKGRENKIFTGKTSSPESWLSITLWARLSLRKINVHNGRWIWVRIRSRGGGAPSGRLGGSIQVTLNKETSSPAETQRQTLGALHTQHKLKTGVPRSWVIWKCIQWGYGSGGRYPDFLIEWIFYWI